MGPPEQEGKRLYLIYISMTELELQQYLLREYPQENARCEWKEFKNLKNSFCGDEKNDVISYVSAIANMDGGDLVIGVHDKTLEIVGTDTYNYDKQKAILRLTERCVNLSTEDLYIDEFITDDTNRKVWVIHIPRHTFATTLCLSQGIPLSTVSKMLGHKQITTTQIYAQTTPIMIEDAIDRVESRLGGKFAV